jgi:6-phosphofructokinase
MVVEVMGRNAGWIALEEGLAGGGDVILIPEIPFRYEAVAAGILERARRGRRFSIVVVAEGVSCPGGGPVVRQIVGDSPDPVRLGGVGRGLGYARGALVPFEVRYVVLGHVQRGGSPTPFDRVLATRFGAAAVAALADRESGRMVALRGARIETVPRADVLSRPKRADPQGERVGAARSIGTIFGDETGTEA